VYIGPPFDEGLNEPLVAQEGGEDQARHATVLKIIIQQIRIYTQVCKYTCAYTDASTINIDNTRDSVRRQTIDKSTLNPPNPGSRDPPLYNLGSPSQRPLAADEQPASKPSTQQHRYN
jgi:hypothetical protein